MRHDTLWAPWRLAFLQGLPADAGAGGDDYPDFLAAYWEHPELDAEQLVVYRDEMGMIVLNRYPYANGHLLVALGEGRPTITDYEPAKRAAFWHLVEVGAALIRHALSPQGINYGINEGHAAGAGLPGHLHAHLVPRWGGDTNFLTVIGSTRVIPDSLQRMAEVYTTSLPAVLESENRK